MDFVENWTNARTYTWKTKESACALGQWWSNATILLLLLLLFWRKETREQGNIFLPFILLLFFFALWPFLKALVRRMLLSIYCLMSLWKRTLMRTQRNRTISLMFVYICNLSINTLVNKKRGDSLIDYLFMRTNSTRE